MKVLISRASINSYIGHNKFVSVNNMLKNMMIWKKKSNILIINKYVWCNKKILIPEEKFTETNYERLKKGVIYIKSNLIDSDGNMFLMVDSLIKIYNIITSSNNITLRNVNAKTYGFYGVLCIWEKNIIEDKLYHIID